MAKDLNLVERLIWLFLSCYSFMFFSLCATLKFCIGIHRPSVFFCYFIMPRSAKQSVSRATGAKVLRPPSSNSKIKVLRRPAGVVLRCPAQQATTAIPEICKKARKFLSNPEQAAYCLGTVPTCPEALGYWNLEDVRPHLAHKPGSWSTWHEWTYRHPEQYIMHNGRIYWWCPRKAIATLLLAHVPNPQ